LTETVGANSDIDQMSSNEWIFFKEYIYVPVTNSNYVEGSKVSVSIKELMPTNAH